jgi:hypothetical protein
VFLGNLPKPHPKKLGTLLYFWGEDNSTFSYADLLPHFCHIGAKTWQKVGRIGARLFGVLEIIDYTLQ